MKGQWWHRDGYGHFFPWNSGKPLKTEAPNGGLSPQTEVGKEGGGKDKMTYPDNRIKNK